jgi:fatty-acyl-CoA synthase
MLLTPNEPHPDMDPTAKPELSAGLSRTPHQPFEAHSAQFIYFTSGSTGKPKGVVISGESVTNNAKFLGFRKGISGGLDVGAVTQPFSHVGGLVVNLLSQMMHGVTNVLPAPSFDPRATLAAVQEEVRPKLAPNHNDSGMLNPCARTVLHEAPPSFELTDIHLVLCHSQSCTVLDGVPSQFTIYVNLSELLRYDLATLCKGATGAATIPPELMKAVTDPKCLNQSYIVGSYGMTETSPISFVGTVEDTLQMTCGSVGRVQVCTN